MGGLPLQIERCVPSARSVDNMKAGVREALASSKAAIKEALVKGKPLNSKHSHSATLDTIGKRMYGFQKSFAFCNQRQPFEHLDNHISKMVADYHGGIVRLLGSADYRVRAMMLGVPATCAMFDLSQAKTSK